MAGLKLVLVFLVCAAVATPLAVESAITCGKVAGSVSQCLGYLQKGGAPPPACCNGVRGLLGLAKTTPDRQSVCTCLKNLANNNSINAANAAKLPRACGVSIPYPISTSTNCATIK